MITSILTTDQKRVMIAKACGYVPTPKLTVNGLPIYERNGKLFAVKVAPVDNADWLPDYLRDLDAMAGARKILTPEQQGDYAFFLADALKAESDYEGLTRMGQFTIINATAAQHAEAFAKTLGLW